MPSKGTFSLMYFMIEKDEKIKNKFLKLALKNAGNLNLFKREAFYDDCRRKK